MKSILALTLFTLAVVTPALSQNDRFLADAPAQPNGYIFYTGLDSPGGDLTYITYDVGGLKLYCDSKPDCVGFNTGGYLKTSLLPQSSWTKFRNNPTQGIYVKTQPVTNADGYVFYQGLDSNNGDITQLAGQTPDKLKAACNSNPTCLGFNTNGYLKSSLQPRSEWSASLNKANEGFYAKPHYVFYQGLDSPGSDITHTSGNATALQSICDHITDCVGFNTNGYIKSSLTPVSKFIRWSDNPTQGLYMKTNVPASS